MIEIMNEKSPFIFSLKIIFYCKTKTKSIKLLQKWLCPPKWFRIPLTLKKDFISQYCLKNFRLEAN